MPRFLIVLLFTEMWERFSYYGMRALLVLFLTSELGFSDPKAYGIYSLMSALCFSGPMIGGFLADKLLGFRKMVIIGGITMVLGHALMALIPLSSNIIFVGLSLIAVGMGLFKGNISNLLGTCYSTEDPKRDKAFTLFYVSVNIGSTLATLACAYTAKMYGWHWGFALAGIGMMAGLIIFVTNNNLFAHDKPPRTTPFKITKNLSITPTQLVATLTVMLAIMVSFMLLKYDVYTKLIYVVGIATVLYLANLLRTLPAHEQGGVALLFTLAIFQMLFFAVEIQLGSLYNLFTQRNVDFQLFGFMLPAAVSQTINPLSIMLMGPLMAMIFSKYCKGRVLTRFNFGLLTLVMSFATIYLGCKNASDSGLVGIHYLIISISFMGFGELCIAPLMLNQCTLLAPKRLRGMLMGVNMLSLAFSSLAGNLISSFMSIDNSTEGSQDTIATLAVYSEGFFKLLTFALIALAAFLCITLYFKFKPSPSLTRQAV
ncbi:MAG: peptide MFS transporter [Francisellaceae bacterium]|jgi:proton-dependent oligopeptide transporter, POT family|nr:peptide MFS transporter [Francisellaceae bacterium]MBT6207557.1 peptide MFS transporter [Francisellaceae bacterium]MBT6538536.1 peptide MFS transporter [Francisellaceae bacterium]